MIVDSVPLRDRRADWG